MSRQRSLRQVLQGFFGRGVCPYEGAFALLNPLRRLILSPTTLVTRLQLAPDARVLEIGPGPGYFTPSVVDAVPEGAWVGLDLQLRMLQALRQRLPAASSSNVGLTQADAMHLPFYTGAFDVVFLVAVLGEVPDPVSCVRECLRVLRPGGLLSITEQPGDPDALTRAKIHSLVGSVGWRPASSYGRGKSFTLNFRAVDDAAVSSTAHMP